MPEQELFLFDDFFVPEDDPGIEHRIQIKGRNVPLFFKRSLSLDDIHAARALAVETRINPKTKEPEIVRVNEAAFSQEILARALISWPFTEKSGKRVPITKETIGLMLAECLPPLMRVIQTLLQGMGQGEQDFFGKGSGEVSS